MQTAEGRRTTGHWILIVAWAVWLLWYLLMTLLTSPANALSLGFIWALGAWPMLFASYRRSGSQPLRRLALLIIPVCFPLVLVAALVSIAPLSVNTTFIALLIALPSDITARAIRRVYLAAPPQADESRRWRSLAAIVAGTAICAAWVFHEDGAFYESPFDDVTADYQYTATHAGCYEVREYHALLPFRADTTRQLQLDTVFGRRTGVFWRPLDARHVMVVSTNGYHGVYFNLTRTRDGYVGSSHSSLDVVTLPRIRRRVRASPVACTSVPFDSVRLVPPSS